jgi:hypothetical protein
VQAPPQAAAGIPSTDELRVAIFHDAIVAIERNDIGLALNAAECRRLHDFLVRMEPVWAEHEATTES